MKHVCNSSYVFGADGYGIQTGKCSRTEAT